MSKEEKKGYEVEEIGRIQVMLGIVDQGKGLERVLGVMEAIGGF